VAIGGQNCAGGCNPDCCGFVEDISYLIQSHMPSDHFCEAQRRTSRVGRVDASAQGRHLDPAEIAEVILESGRGSEEGKVTRD
jgi:hypothetical protein